MLLKDGVRYDEWIPEGNNAEDELERMVVEHSDDIFGQNSIYLDKKIKLKTAAGVGSIPDGFAIILNSQPEWHIVEVELSSHDIYSHVIDQVTRFMDGIENLNTKESLFEAIWDVIKTDYLLKHKLEIASGDSNPHEFLSKLIKKTTPTLSVIIEIKSQYLDNTLNKFTYLPHKITEFRTFRRTDALNVHAHLFEPLTRVKSKSYKVDEEVNATSTSRLEPFSHTKEAIDILLQQNSIDAYYLSIPTQYETLFPNLKTRIIVESDIGILNTQYNPVVKRIQTRLQDWFKAHRQLKVGSIVRISVVEPMKKYRLEIVK
jgi:hypothetical protein